MPVADRTTLNNLTPNLDIGDVADPALRLAFFQYITNLTDANYAEMQALVTSGTLSPVPPRNMWQQGIINGGMGVIQRFGDLGSRTLATGTSAYVVDRIKSFNNGSGVNATVSQLAVSDLDGAGHGLQIVHASTPTTGGKLAHSYTLEAKDAYKWAGLAVVKALKVKGVGGMDQITINARYKTSESAVDSSSTLISSTTVAISNSSWQVVPLTVSALPIRATLTTTGVIGFEIVFSKSTAEASGDGGIITELELIKGGSDLGYQPRNLADELALCQRYYEPCGSGVHGRWSTANNAILVSTFRVKKRVTPTPVLLTTTPTITEPGASDRVGSASTVIGNVVTASGYYCTVTGFTGATVGAMAISLADIIGFDAEL